MASKGQGTPRIHLVGELIGAQAVHDAQRGRMVHRSGAKHRQDVLLGRLACKVHFTMIQAHKHCLYAVLPDDAWTWHKAHMNVVEGLTIVPLPIQTLLSSLLLLLFPAEGRRIV